MGRDFEMTVDQLEPGHIADLRKLRDDPQFKLHPVRRRMYLRLKLINPCKSMPPPQSRMLRKPKRRQHTLTEIGMAIAGATGG